MIMPAREIGVTLLKVLNQTAPMQELIVALRVQSLLRLLLRARKVLFLALRFSQYRNLRSNLLHSYVVQVWSWLNIGFFYLMQIYYSFIGHLLNVTCQLMGTVHVTVWMNSCFHFRNHALVHTLVKIFIPCFLNGPASNSVTNFTSVKTLNCGVLKWHSYLSFLMRLHAL